MCWNKNLGIVGAIFLSCMILALGIVVGCGEKKDGSSAFTVKASVKAGNGIVDPESQTVNSGEAASVDIKPDEGYYIASIIDNGMRAGFEDPYVIERVAENHDVEVIFGKGAYFVVPGEDTDGLVPDEEAVGECPDAPETYMCSISEQAQYEAIAWEAQGDIEITISPEIPPYVSPETPDIDMSDVKCGVSGGGEIPIYGEGPMEDGYYTASGTNTIEVQGYCMYGWVHLEVTEYSAGTMTVEYEGYSYSSEVPTQTWSYILMFDMGEAHSGEFDISAQVESGTTTWIISPAG